MGHPGHDLHVILVAPDSEHPWRRSAPGCVEDYGRRLSVREAIDYAAHAIDDTAGDGRRGTIRIDTASGLDHAIVRISDDGLGIPDDIRERIFGPFFTAKEVGRGTGQGLAVARSIIVDRHAGSLRISSLPGHSATFSIRLPLRDPATVSGSSG